MSRHRTPGRRRAPGAVRRLPDGFSRLGATWAAKSVAAVGVVGGAALALALPVDASPAALTLPVAATAGAQARTDSFVASRSQGRASAVAAPAVSAPADAAPVAPDAVGVAGVKAVAKPKPKPKAVVAQAASGSSSSSAAKVNVSAGGISSKCGSIGLSSNAARLCTAVQKTFGISSIGGYRAGDPGDHGSGNAVDIMVSGARGDAVAAFVQANVGAYNVKYVIWRQRYWEPGSSWRGMSDRGSVTANHYDHVHVSVN